MRVRRVIQGVGVLAIALPFFMGLWPQPSIMSRHSFLVFVFVVFVFAVVVFVFVVFIVFVFVVIVLSLLVFVFVPSVFMLSLLVVVLVPSVLFVLSGRFIPLIRFGGISNKVHFLISFNSPREIGLIGGSGIGGGSFVWLCLSIDCYW